MMPTFGNEGAGSGGDDRAVSPVVGVALLIAITVILAAVIGFVVLDTTDAENAASTDARLDFSYDSTDSELTIRHEGGDSIDNSNLKIKDPNGNTVTSRTENIGSEAIFDTGDSYVISDPASGQYTVVYDDPNSDRQNQLGKFEVP